MADKQKFEDLPSSLNPPGGRNMWKDSQKYETGDFAIKNAPVGVYHTPINLQDEQRAKDMKAADELINKQRKNNDAETPGYKKGGKVKKTGKAKVHKGEYVVKKSAAAKPGMSDFLSKLNNSSTRYRST